MTRNGTLDDVRVIDRRDRAACSSKNRKQMEKVMKIVVIGANGVIGSAVVKLLKQRHQIVAVSRSSGDHNADITKAASIETALDAIGEVDAIVNVAGTAVFKPLAELADADFETSLHDKLMGQVNVVRAGAKLIRPGGSITLTSGVLAQEPVVGSSVISIVNSGIEGFGRAAALELRNAQVRVNVVSPPWIKETLEARNIDFSPNMRAADVAR